MIINPDIAVGRKHFAIHQEQSKVLVTGAFRTLQGEAPYTGWPAVFLRTAGCNYGAKDTHCQFCDTFFAYEQGQALGFDALSKMLTELPGYSQSDLLVLTGGEPSLQLALARYLVVEGRDLFHHGQFETNGTQPWFWVTEEMQELLIESWLTVVVSPKPNTKTGTYAKLDSRVLDVASCLKFVVSNDPQSPHSRVPDWALEWRDTSGCPIYVSPMAAYLRPPVGEVANAWDHTLVDAETTQANYAAAAEYALANNFRLSIQTHLFTNIP